MTQTGWQPSTIRFDQLELPEAPCCAWTFVEQTLIWSERPDFGTVTFSPAAWDRPEQEAFDGSGMNPIIDLLLPLPSAKAFDQQRTVANDEEAIWSWSNLQSPVDVLGPCRERVVPRRSSDRIRTGELTHVAFA